LENGEPPEIAIPVWVDVVPQPGKPETPQAPPSSRLRPEIAVAVVIFLLLLLLVVLIFSSGAFSG
jgi:ABC-type Na+ efflux pump permease subunit